MKPSLIDTGKRFLKPLSYIKDIELCTDITHDIFLNIWNKRTHLDILFFKEYLKTAARYHVYKKQKSLRKLQLEYVDEYENIPQVSVKNTAEDQFNLRELELNIEFLLTKLPKRCKEIFQMSRYENLSNAEIAERLAISKRSVENQITTALKYLREHIKEIGVAILIIHILK
jgi:RNA polymerase sigma factor (sigma-70 family)